MVAKIRRVLIVIVGIALILDAAALAYIKFGKAGASDSKVKLVLWIDDPGQAGTAKKLLTEQGLDVSATGGKRSTEVEAGFRVVLPSTVPEVLKSSEKVLRNTGFNQLSYSPDKTELYYGGYFKTEAEAKRVVDQIEAQGVIFQVAKGRKTVAKASQKLVIASMPASQVDKVNTGLSQAKIKIADQVETPLDKKSGSKE